LVLEDIIRGLLSCDLSLSIALSLDKEREQK